MVRWKKVDINIILKNYFNIDKNISITSEKIDSYELADKIINEALSKKCLVKDTNKYNKFNRCIKLTNTLQWNKFKV